MTRLLGGVLLATAALTAVPAEASNWPVRPIVWTEPDRVGVGAEYSFNGSNYDALGAAYVNPRTGRACVGFFTQIPFCAGGPIN